MTHGTKPAHVAWATFEAIILQIADIFEAMQSDIKCGFLASGRMVEPLQMLLSCICKRTCSNVPWKLQWSKRSAHSAAPQWNSLRLVKTGRRTHAGPTSNH
ncbi:hypothetical protein GTW23_00050 [Hoeflea alexandrii]|uniref:Uncharacterized protein n=2 Tax=Hoeflea alexandrii TaxID=288436 RepID=A0ABT1CLR5_9HYPH|nr:hypothetical protein [Hoeflea alexandrii]